MKFLIINGPNMNFLGIREPQLYGKENYEALCKLCQETCEKLGIFCECFQSNYEGALVDRIQQAYFEKIDGIVINSAAYSHTSIAIYDALEAVKIPTISVHITDVKNRESFRQNDYTALASIKTIAGKGILGYTMAIESLYLFLTTNRG